MVNEMDAQNIVSRLQEIQGKLKQNSVDEVCSSIRYEALQLATGYQMAIGHLCFMLSKELPNFQNPYELCKCVKCKEESMFKDLEVNEGICIKCVDQ